MQEDLSKLYEKLAEKFSGEKDTSEFWMNLSLDNKLGGSLLAFRFPKVDVPDQGQKNLSESISTLLTLHSRIHDMSDGVHKDDFDLKRAIVYSLILEQELSERIWKKTTGDLPDDALKEVFEELSSDAAKHRDMLLHMGRRSGMNAKEIQGLLGR